MGARRHRIVEEDVDRVLAAPLPWSQLDGATVLVTGAGGFLPAFLVDVLLRRGELGPGRTTVLGLVRSRERAARRLGHLLDHPALRLIEGDAAAPPPIDGPVDFVIHAASPATPRAYGVDPVGTIAPNVLGTAHLLALARQRASRRLLFLSSGEVYGRVRDDQVPTPETALGLVDPLDVRSCYAESKRAGEALCVAWHHQHGVPAVIARPFHTYGPGLDLGDGRVFADFVADAVAGRDLVMKSDGRARRAFCYLADAAAGLFTALLRGEPGQAYNVGNPAGELSITELAELVAGLVPGRGLKVIRQPRPPDDTYLQSHIPRNSPDVVRLAALGWSPVTPPAEGFRRTILSFLPEGAP